MFCFTFIFVPSKIGVKQLLDIYIPYMEAETEPKAFPFPLILPLALKTPPFALKTLPAELRRSEAKKPGLQVCSPDERREVNSTGPIKASRNIYYVYILSIVCHVCIDINDT